MCCIDKDYSLPKNSMWLYLLDEKDGEWEIHEVSEDIGTIYFLWKEMIIDRQKYQNCKFYFPEEFKKMQTGRIYQAKHEVEYIYNKKNLNWDRNSKMVIIGEYFVFGGLKAERKFGKDGLPNLKAWA